MTETAAEIGRRLGLHQLKRGWRGDCPSCGYAGAFSVRSGRAGIPLLFCASCRDNAALARVVLGEAQPSKPNPVAAEAREASRAATLRRALALWNGAAPVAGTPGEAYLATRHIAAVASSAALRYRSDTPHPEGGRLPALMALVQNVSGEPIGIHRTFLKRDGSGKAEVEPAKASLGPIWGGAIRLHDVAPELVVAEGVETAAAAGVLAGLPAWAALSAGNLDSGLVLPAEVRAVVIAADPDPAGERAALKAAARWKAEGRRVRIARPNIAGHDFNDVLMARGGAR